MKKVISLFLIISVMLITTSCAKSDEASVPNIQPQIAQMRSICELATMDCYYHNVAKYFEEDAEKGFLGFGKKDKHFWVEYSGEVTIGIDATLVMLEISGTNVTITIPPAKVLGYKVHQETLNKDSFIVAKNSADITAEDQTKAYQNAQANMLQTASNDITLLANAQQRAQMLLEDYVTNIGNSIGVNYQITWIYVDETGAPIRTSNYSTSTESSTDNGTT